MLFVTGANGLVGSYICRALLKKGYAIKALRRTNSDLSLLADVQDQIEWVEGDLDDPVLLKRLLVGAKGIIHAAGLVSFARQDYKQLHKVNAEGTANLLHAATDTGVTRFVHISSVAALGRDPKKPEMDETVKWVESPHNSEYAKSKYQGELEVHRAQAEGMQTVVVNPSFVIGPGDWNRSSTRLFKYVFDENRFYTKGLLNYVDARDVADVVSTLYESDISGERFILSAGSCSYRDFFNQIAGHFDVKPPRQEATPFLQLLAYLADSVRSWFTGSKPLITAETRRMSGLRYAYDGHKITHAISFQYRGLNESLVWVCEQLKAQK